VHFDLRSGGSSLPKDLLGGSSGSGGGARTSFRRSISMAELAAAELVREEEYGLQTRDSADTPTLAAMAAEAAQQEREQARQLQQQR
jgi:hypothetical protein